MITRMILSLVLGLFGVNGLAEIAPATLPSKQFLPKKSSFAIVTGREGLASGLAHRHIILAQAVTGSLNYTMKADKSSIASGKAEIQFPAKKLLVDDVDATEEIRAFLSERGVWSATADRLDPSIREKVTENMLDSSQLDADNFPTISGVGNFSDCQSSSPQSSRCNLDVTITVHGKSVTKNVELTINQDDGGQTGRFVASFKFTEFGIKPYSAMLGAIRVSDEFQIAAVLRAE